MALKIKKKANMRDERDTRVRFPSYSIILLNLKIFLNLTKII